MSNSFPTTTTKITTPHRKLKDEQLNRHNNNKNTTPHRKLNHEQLNPHSNNKKIRHHTKIKTMNNSILTTTTKREHQEEN
jgi:hypothetical protein